MRRFLMVSLLGLAACATPLERCISNATKDIRVLNRLIATTEGNINRGYAIVTQEYLDTEEQVCGVVENVEVYCEVPVAETRKVPQAIDLNAEAAKLNSLITKRAELTQRADAVIAECQIVHPAT